MTAAETHDVPRAMPNGARTPVPGDPAAPAPLRRRAHLHQVDVVRLLTFASVIAVHTITMTNPGSSIPAGVAQVLLHFTREAFFLLSAFVLFYSQGDKPLRLRSFWSRRFLLIGVPYLVWSVAYWLLGLRGSALSAGSLRTLGKDVLTGTAEYHLYFLLVSMQLYLVFPALVWLIRKTRDHHLALLLASLALELATLAALQWGHAHGGFWGGLEKQAYVLLPTYQFYFVAGALAAVHHDRFTAWITERTAAVLGAVAGLAMLSEAAYAAQILTGSSPNAADAPLQPAMVPWSVAVTVGLYALGCAYARARRPGRLARAVERASLVSFGVYLIHPLVLDRLLVWWLRPAHTPAPASTLLAWACTLVISFAVVTLVSRTPASLPLTGRRRMKSRPMAGTG